MRALLIALELLLGCETREVKQLEQLKARLDVALEERKACAEQPRACVAAPKQLALERTRLERVLPAAEARGSASELTAPVAGQDAFRRALASAAGTHGLTLELRLDAELKLEQPACAQPVTLTVLGSDDDAATLAGLVLDLSRVAQTERAARLHSTRRGWQIEGALPWFCGAASWEPEPEAAAADGIARSRLSGQRAHLLRQAIAIRGAELTWWRTRTPYPPALRAERTTIDAWRNALATALTRRKQDRVLVALLRNRQAALDRIVVDGRGGAVVEGVGGLSDPRVAFGDSWDVEVEGAPSGRFRVALHAR